jgi:glycosyltransferase involved in cell wall biosynthesis
MRILFVTNTFPPDYTGGAEVALFHTSRGLMRRGHACSVLSINNKLSQPADEWYYQEDLLVHRVRLGRRWPLRNDVYDPRVYSAVRAEIERFRPDLLNIQNISGMTLAPYRAAEDAGVPVVNTLHDHWLLCPNNMLYQRDGTFCDPSLHPERCGKCFTRYDYWAVVPKRRRLFRWATRTVSKFISPSQALIDIHVAGGFERSRFALVRYGFFDEATAEPIHPEVRALSQRSDGRPTVVFAGGGVEIKGAPVVLRMMPELIAQIPQIRVVVAGGGDVETLNGLRRYTDNVMVLGPVPFTDMRALFEAGDLTIQASTWAENLPVVIFESHQMGTPVVASAIGGMPEQIVEGDTGYLFPPGDHHALAQRIVTHFARPAIERRRMRLACRQFVNETFSLKAHLDRTEEVYVNVLAASVHTAQE